jgi:hypothetical protein
LTKLLKTGRLGAWVHPRRRLSNRILCLGADGTGKTGPTQIGKDGIYKQVLTDRAMFPIIYSGSQRRDATISSLRHEARRNAQDHRLCELDK